MNTYRNLFFITLALLMIAVAALITVIAGKPAQETTPTTTVKPGYGFDYISSQLKFSDEQKEAFDKLVSDYRGATEPLYQQLNEIQHQMADIMDMANPDTTRLNELNKKMSGVYALIKKETTHHMLNVRSICTPEQKAELGKIYRSVIDETSRGHRRGNGQGRNRHRYGQGGRM